MKMILYMCTALSQLKCSKVLPLWTHSLILLLDLFFFRPFFVVFFPLSFYLFFCLSSLVYRSLRQSESTSYETEYLTIFFSFIC